MHFYKENIEFYKLKPRQSNFSIIRIKNLYDDIKQNGIKNHLLVNDKNVIQLGGTRYFILRLLKIKKCTKIPCIIYSDIKITDKKEISVELVSKLTNLTVKQIFRSIQ